MFHVTSHSQYCTIIIALTRSYPSWKREDAPPSMFGLFHKLNICSRPTAASRGISWRGQAACTRMNLIEILAVRGDHQSSSGRRRAERRKQDGEKRHPGFYDLVSRGRGPLSCLSAFRVRTPLGFSQSEDDLASEKSRREKANKVSGWL